MKKGYWASLIIMCLFASLHIYGYKYHTKQIDSLLNLIQKTEHNNLKKMNRFADEFLQIPNNAEARFYGTYYAAKAKYYRYSLKDAVTCLDSLYETIKHRKFNPIKYEIDLLVSEYYFRQDNFEAGFERLKKILKYGNSEDFKLAAYLLPGYSYLNVERAIEYIENNISHSYGKFTNKPYFKERLKRGLLSLKFKYKNHAKDEKLILSYEQNIETCKNNSWKDLAIENLHSLVYTYKNDTLDEQLKALNSINEAIDLAKEIGSTYLLTKLYHTKGHVYSNLAGLYKNDDTKLKDTNKITRLKNKQLTYYDAAYKTYEQALRYAHIQQNTNRISRLYSSLGSMKLVRNKIVKSDGVLEEMCTLYSCALNEMDTSNFEAMKVLKGRINSGIIYFGLQPCLSQVRKDAYNISGNKHLINTEMSVAKTDFERQLFQHENTLNIKHNKSEIRRNVLIIFIPLLLLSLVYYYRQKYLMLKQIEKQNILIQAQNKSLKQAVRRLERANRGLENFAFTAAHDIKSPLRSIASFTGLLKRKYYNPESEDNVLFFDYVIKGCEDLSYFVDNLLKFSTILHKKTPSKEVDLNEVLTKIRHRHRRTLEEEKACLKIKETLPLLQAHYSLVYQLFYNLITNSIKFRKQDVPTSIEVGCQLKEKERIFYVKDNGIGIAPEKQKEVFDLFTKLHANTEYNGFGIGLATCKKIVHHYKGKLWLKSTSGLVSVVSISWMRNISLAFKPKVSTWLLLCLKVKL